MDNQQIPGLDKKTTLTILVSSGVLVGWSVFSSISQSGPITASIITYLLYAFYWFYAIYFNNPLIQRLVIFGTIAGILELVTDHYLVSTINSLVYPGDEPMIWSSPLYMPFAWSNVLLQLGFVGVLFTRRLGIGLASVALCIAGGMYIPLYEHLANAAGWWWYHDNVKMVFDAPFYIIVSEALISLSLPFLIIYAERHIINKIIYLGLIEGVWILISAIIAYTIAKIISFMNLAALVDWFIHTDRKQDLSEYKKTRLFVRASLLTSLFSNSYIWLSFYFEYSLGANLMIFNVLGFLVLSFLAKTRIPLLVLGHAYVFVGAFAVIVLTYFSGGIWSAIYPWIISIPVLALLVVNRNAGIFWGILSFAAMVWMGVLAIQGIDLPVQYNTEMKTEWFVSVLPGLLLIVMMVSMVFESVQRKALSDLEANNELLREQKGTIEKQAEAMEKLLDEKDQIIRIMAHDLKNPLSNITSLSELLKDMKRPEEQKEIIQMIEQVSGKAQDLIAKVLDMAVLEQGGIVVHLEELDLVKIVYDAVSELNELAKRKGISVSVEPEAKSFNVVSDKTYMQLVFENLISNALKFSKKQTSVKIQIGQSDNQVQVKVMDEGPGIKPEEEHMLFKKFSLLSARPTAGENSTGVGLSLVKTYLEKLDGNVWYDGSYSKGAAFVVELPLAG